MPWLFFAYPLLAHLATLIHSEALGWLALLVLIAVPLLPGLRAGRWQTWLGLLAVALALYGCAAAGWTRYLMYVPPVLIPGVMLWVFLRTLRPGEVPLVTRLATRIRGSLPDELQAYTRHVTQFWVGLLAILMLGSVLLAAFATPEIWSLMTNFVQYLILGAAFALEYAYRRWRFGHLEHESFARFVSALFTTRAI